MLLDFLNHGPLMDESGDGGMGGGGVATDTGGGESTALTTTDSTDLATTTDDHEESTTQELQPFRAMENGRVSKAATTALEPVRASNPQLAREISSSLATSHRLRSMFPGQNPFDGIRALQSRLGDYEKIGPIEDIRSTFADIEELDLLYAGGDPRMVDKMTSTPEGQLSFAKVFPHSVDKVASLPNGKAAILQSAQRFMAHWEKLGPNAFTKYMAGMILNDALTHRIHIVVQTLGELLKENATALPEVQKLQKYLNRLIDLEDKTVAETAEIAEQRTDPRNTELDTRAQDLARKEKELELRGWKSQADSDKASIFNGAWSKETKDRKLSPITQEDIRSAIATRLPIALKQFPGFESTLKRFYEANDKDGYVRYLKSMHETHIPRIVRAEVQKRAGAKPGPATGTAAVAGTVKQPVPQGFKRVSVKPPHNTINRRLTDLSMIKRGEYILNDGSRVKVD